MGVAALGVTITAATVARASGSSWSAGIASSAWRRSIETDTSRSPHGSGVTIAAALSRGVVRRMRLWRSSLRATGKTRLEQ